MQFNNKVFFNLIVLFRIISCQYLNWCQLGADIHGEAAQDRFGVSTAINDAGSIVAIGALQNDGGGGASGHVRVFGYDGAVGWNQLGADIDGEWAGDMSGGRDTISLNSIGNIVAIGAVGNEPNGPSHPDLHIGHTRIFQYSARFNNWNQIGQDIDGRQQSDRLGWSVSLNDYGNIVAIGAPQCGQSCYPPWNGLYPFPYADTGYTQIHQFNGTAWNQLGADIDFGGFTKRDTTTSGFAVSLNGNGTIVAIGAPEYQAQQSALGRVRIYKYYGTSWLQLGGTIYGKQFDEMAGWTISLNNAGDRIAIGAPMHLHTGMRRGATRIYKYVQSPNSLSGAWVQLGADILGEITSWPGSQQSQSGFSVSLNCGGDVVAIGAALNDGNGTSSGHVRVYQWVGNSWNIVGGDIDGEASYNYFGYDVAINCGGDKLVGGAPLNSDSGVWAGHARVYEYCTSSPTAFPTNPNMRPITPGQPATGNGRPRALTPSPLSKSIP